MGCLRPEAVTECYFPPNTPAENPQRRCGVRRRSKLRGPADAIYIHLRPELKRRTAEEIKTYHVTVSVGRGRIWIFR